MTTTQIDIDAITILGVLADAPRDEYVDNGVIAEKAGLPADRVNDAMALLVDAGYVEWIQTFGTAPYDFNCAMITSRGRYEWQRLQATVKAPAAADRHTSPKTSASEPSTMALEIRPPSPVGSPFGFTDEDWEAVSARKSDPQQLFTVLGHQFESTHFDSGVLRDNVASMLRSAIERYNQERHGPPVILKHCALNAGYGEHLFNEIARDIIGADIAVFEVSDLNPNVMLEMGVALTWGIRVLPIKKEGQPKPPTDVSGQTWADYRDNAATFTDSEHENKLIRMIERALRKKVRGVV
jgi:hypothetical protein